MSCPRSSIKSLDAEARRQFEVARTLRTRLRRHTTTWPFARSRSSEPDRGSSELRQRRNDMANRAKRSEKGLLTPDNCVVTLIDLQPQMLFGVANFDRQTIINNNVALSKAARVFDVPVVLSTVETKGFSGNMWPQIQAVFPNLTPIERTSMNSWDDENFVAAVKKSGRQKRVLSGLWPETCAALPTIQASHAGYQLCAVRDC